MFTLHGVLRREWERFRHLWTSREGGVWTPPARQTLWEPVENEGTARGAWEHTRQRLGFIAYHVTQSNTVFIDRVQSDWHARRKGTAREMIRRTVGPRASELQVHRNNVPARRLYEDMGYVRVTEGEYIPQHKHIYMKRLEGGAQQGTIRKDVEYVSIGGSRAVPTEVWLWMEQQIVSNDGGSRFRAQNILKPWDRNMRYMIAVLRAGRSDEMGRNLRTVRQIDYSETRHYERHGGNTDALGSDRGRIHHKAKWGWRLHAQMVSTFDKLA